jgi:hypothetical protein
MRKQVIAAGVILLLAVTAFVIGGVSRAAATGGGGDCTPTPGTDPVFSQWTFDHFTEWQVSDVAPADPDGQAGEDNPLNLSTIGDREERVVTDQEATEDTEVFDHWQRYSLTGGSWPEGPVPAFPDPGDPFRWQANVAGDPHDRGVEGAYSVSHGQSGNTDWFYLEAVNRTVPGQDAVTHVEYRWAVLTRTFTPGEDPVECPPVECPPGTSPWRDGCHVDFDRQTQNRENLVLDCVTDTVTTTREFRQRVRRGVGPWSEWTQWQVAEVTERDATDEECPTTEEPPTEEPPVNEPPTSTPTVGPPVVQPPADPPVKRSTPAVPTAVDAGI